MKVIYFAEAKEELDGAIAFYDGKRDGLGDEFYAEVQSAVERIKALPNARVVIANRPQETGKRRCFSRLRLNF